ncbi:hypothetical protein Q8A67_019446 [Cirrhinus molitorella]|uniref:Myb/SANT-like DNA-binding domain-containing protein n=1 Tax=Cirrhinus molitorella TaxID=172907 RepID=A0AA88P770_9TELE|nr:hypothetical protein Q8A67_019446 [Cirrhinus molitorella]
MAKRAKKRNLTNTELEVLVDEVESNQQILFSSLTAGGITNKRKNATWEKVTSAVNSVGSEERTVPEIKKKWFDIKVLAKKRVTAHRREISATGGGQTTTELSPLDNRIACIIGDTALSGINKDGDTDLLTTQQPGPSNTESEVTPIHCARGASGAGPVHSPFRAPCAKSAERGGATKSRGNDESHQ